MKLSSKRAKIQAVQKLWSYKPSIEKQHAMKLPELNSRFKPETINFQEQVKRQLTHLMHHRSRRICRILQLSPLFFYLDTTTASQTNLSLSSFMLRIRSTIHLFVKGRGAKVFFCDIRTVMPFLVPAATAWSAEGHLTIAKKHSIILTVHQNDFPQ